MRWGRLHIFTRHLEISLDSLGMSLGASMDFRVLGTLEVLDQGQPVVVSAPRQRMVLAALLVHANEVVSTDRLLDLVWGDDQPDVGALRYQVSKLREALGDSGVIETRAPGYVFEVEWHRVDALLFEDLVGQARQIRGADPEKAAALLQDALALWRGDPYAEFAYEDFVHLERERLSEMRRGAIEDRLDLLLELGRHKEVIPELEKLTRQHPTRERLWGQLGLALYRSGRQADAVAALGRLRDLLGDSGLDLSPELRELEDRILTQDASLAVDVAVPERLRGYVLRGRIGDGAHGVVWRAAQPGVGREVAIKAIRPELANRPDFVRRFEAEAQLVAALEHPHIVSLFDFWRDPDGAYLVMPYLRGGSLADRLEKGPLDPTIALGLLREVGAALMYAHRRGVVHRDVTPRNVLLDDDGNAYLADFGVAGLLGEKAAQGVEGTPSAAYLSPELLAGEGGSPASDVFSLGVIAEAVLSDGEVSPAVSAVAAGATRRAPEERYPSVDEFLEALADATGGAIEPGAAPLELRNPYKGLRAFGEADAGDFFGRDQLVAELVDVVGRHRLVGVVGPSGCGKSSLVRAGLVPKLRRGALVGSERWLITDMYPGARPFAELAAALLQVAVEPLGDLETRLSTGDWEVLTAELLPGDGELLLVVDQFEELFTVTTDAEERRRFLEVLAGLVSDPRHRVRVVATMRADFYDRPLGYPEYGELLRRGLVSITTPGKDAMLEATAGPARAEGLEVAPGLAETVVGDVADQPGGLPLLEYALTELFRHRDGNRLTPEGYRRTGGVLGALGTRAEELYREQPASGQEAVRQVLLRLVNVAEGAEDTRRRVLLSELHGLGIDSDTLQGVLDSFVNHRLLTLDRDPDSREPTVEVAHEALLGRWERLRTWIDDRRDDLVLHRRLVAAVDEWRASGHRTEYLVTGGRLDHFESFAASTDLAIGAEESTYLAESRRHSDELATRRRRRRRSIMAGFAVAALIAVILAVVALIAQRRAEDASFEAQDNQQQALREAARADEQADLAEAEAVRATQEADRANEEADRAEREASLARARDLASSAVLAAESDALLAKNLAVLAFETLPDGEEPGPALESALRVAKSADRSAGRYEVLDHDVAAYTYADLSPDGSAVAVTDGRQLVVFDSATMEAELWSYRAPGPESEGLAAVAYSSDGEFIVVSVVDERTWGSFQEDASDAAGDPDPRLLIFEADSGELVRTQPLEPEGACSGYITPGSWRSDLGLLGIGVDSCDSGGIAFQFVDTTTWEVVFQHPIPPNELPFVIFGGEGTLAVMTSGYSSGIAKSWLIDTADWSIVRELKHTLAAFSPNGKEIAGYRRDRLYVVLEDAITGAVIDRFPTGSARAVDLRFSPAGDVLAVGTKADSTLLFDVETGELMDTIQPAPAVTTNLTENYLYVAGSGVVSKWDTTGIGLGDLNTVPLGLWVNANSIRWISGGTVMAEVADATIWPLEWSLYPVDSSTGDLGEPIPADVWSATPIAGDRAVMFRYRETVPGVQEYDYGPLEVVDLSTGDSTVIAGCWMEEQAALAHEPCPDGEPHPAGLIAIPGSRNGTEFMIQDEQGAAGPFASIWDSSTLTEVERVPLGGLASSDWPWWKAVLTEEYLVLIGHNESIHVIDRVTHEVLFEDAVAGARFTEHDRARNRVWMTNNHDAEVWMIDLDTLEFRSVIGPVTDFIRGLATSPSGELVAVGSMDGFLRIYTDEGELRHSIPLPNPSDAWWLDEENLAVGTGNGPWTVITLDSDLLLDAVKASLRRGFTDDECSLYEIDPCRSLEELQGS